MGFCKLWAKIVWKMRSVYCSLAVHLFDVLTDVLVIISWFKYPDKPNDGIDPRVMAYCAITVLLFHKLISIIAFWAKEENLIRCLLQFFDLLIFEEIYTTHQRVITQFKIKSMAAKDKSYDTNEKSEEAIETTQTFKFVRNLEAVFEAISQSILQLVFIMRIGSQSEGSGVLLLVSILSNLQSTISMTNTILKNDNLYMTLPKWKRYKKRLPPTCQFMGHAICRLSEVIYRICLLSLFCTVCGGEAFAVLMAVEFLTLCFFVCGYDLTHDGLTLDDAYLRFQQLIIMPSELVYALQGRNIDLPTNDMPCIFRCCIFLWCGGICCGSCFCCAGAAVLFSTCCLLREEWYVHMTIRIGVSMLEWTILIIWGSVDDEKSDYLFSANHGLSIFIISFTCYFIYTQYMTLFPNFKLPHGIPIRSKWN